MPTRTLEDLLLHELRELYDAEHELVKLLAALAREVRDERTAQLFNTLRCETRNHVFGLEQALSTLGHVPRRVKSRRLQGLVEGYQAFLRTKPSQAVLDAFDLALAQKAVRGNSSCYRILITLALCLGFPQIVDPLRQHLWEEEAAAERLPQQLSGREPEPAGDDGLAPTAAPLPRLDRPQESLPPPVAAASRVPPDSPEDRENVLAGGQEAF